MSRENPPIEDQRIGLAIAELEGLIRSRYHDATFTLTASADEPEAVHLLTFVDIDDPEQVLDLVLDRVLELQVDQGLPVHVIPMRPASRSEASPATTHSSGGKVALTF